MAIKTHKRVRLPLNDVHHHITGKIHETIEYLQKVVADNPDVINITIEGARISDIDNPEYGYREELEIRGERLLTKKELDALKKDTADHAEYERLRQKFGDIAHG